MLLIQSAVASDIRKLRENLGQKGRHERVGQGNTRISELIPHLNVCRDYARAQRAPLALEASSLAQNTLANSTTGCSSSVLSHKLSARRLVKEESRDAFSGSEAVAES